MDEAQLLDRRVAMPMCRAAPLLDPVHHRLLLALRLRCGPPPVRLRLTRRLPRLPLLQGIRRFALELRPILAVDEEGDLHCAADEIERRRDPAQERTRLHLERLHHERRPRLRRVRPDLVAPQRPRVRTRLVAVAAGVQRHRCSIVRKLLRWELLDLDAGLLLELVLRQLLAARVRASCDLLGARFRDEELLQAHRAYVDLL
mmetsp:Transcript_34624/g.91115  ORF Transcript_34624/g.91115 Transcript_34624/m.91115 type:complete len:202 (-) Transcript_34624:197-802(-)